MGPMAQWVEQHGSEARSMGSKGSIYVYIFLFY